MIDAASFAHGVALGFGLGFGLFIVPGPKDITVLREAASRRVAPLPLVAIAVMSDAALIGLGIAGASALFQRFPGLRDAALWLGAGFMLLHAADAARRVVRGGVVDSAAGSSGRGLATVVAASLLNPVAWLDTVVLVGGVGAALPAAQQAAFAGGAIAASLAWFLVLVAGAHRAGRWLASAATRRLMDAAVAVAMTALAAATLYGGNG